MTECAANQILYNLTRRGPEHDLLPWLGGHRIAAMAYSPVEQGRLVRDDRTSDIARRLGVTPAQVALGWTLRREGLIAIPKAGSVEHVRENRSAAELDFSDDDLAALDAAFPPPRTRRALEML